MRFLYKINSGYDGFTPSQIPNRLRGNDLVLGWRRYLDDVSVGDECWVFFLGPHAFQAGVYIKGFVRAIDRTAETVLLRVREWNAQTPLTDPVTTGRIANAVGVRFRQVFLWPDDLSQIPECGLESCRRQLCQRCPVWSSFPVVRPEEYTPPANIPAEAVVPGYWLIPARCYLHREYKRPAAWVERVSHMFGELKLGEAGYAYPLALGMFSALQARGLLEFDAVVPIPLSPDKLAAGELHRTLELARHLGRQLGVPVRDWLSLSQPISKRRLQASGCTHGVFTARYSAALEVNAGFSRVRRVLLVDDTITRGWTLGCAIRRIRQTAPNVEVVAASAGQMIIKSFVRDERHIVRRAPT